MSKINLNQVLTSLRAVSHNHLTEEETAFADAFAKHWPDHVPILRKFHKHPGCSSCRRDLLEVLSDEPLKLQRFVEDAPPLVDPADASRTPQAAYSAAGRCVDLPDTPQAFTDFLRSITATNGKYKGVQVRPLEDNMVRVYVY